MSSFLILILLFVSYSLISFNFYLLYFPGAAAEPLGIARGALRAPRSTGWEPLNYAIPASGRLWLLPEVEGAALVQVHITLFLAVLHLLTLCAPQHVGRYQSLSNCYPLVTVCNSDNVTFQCV